MRYTLKYLKKQKIRKVSLYVNWPNARAIPFYYLFGFKITRLSIKKGEGEIIWMKKHL